MKGTFWHSCPSLPDSPVCFQVSPGFVLVSQSSDDEGGQRGGAGIDFSNVSLRIRVEDVSTGEVKLETRFPAKWMASVATFVPQLVRAQGPCRPQLFGTYATV